MKHTMITCKVCGWSFVGKHWKGVWYPHFHKTAIITDVKLGKPVFQMIRCPGVDLAGKEAKL